MMLQLPQTKVFERDFITRLRITAIAFAISSFIGAWAVYALNVLTSIGRVTFQPLSFFLLVWAGIYGIVGGSVLLGMVRQRSINVAALNWRPYTIRKTFLHAVVDFAFLFSVTVIYNVLMRGINFPLLEAIVEFAIGLLFYLIQRITEYRRYTREQRKNQH